MGAGRGAELKYEGNLHQHRCLCPCPDPHPQQGGVTSQNCVAPLTLVEDEEEGAAQLVAVQSWGYHGAPRVQGEDPRVWHTRVSLTVCCSCA